jgi:hypothetical protein
MEWTWGVKRCWKCRVTFNRDINACLTLDLLRGFSFTIMDVRQTDFSSPSAMQHLQLLPNTILIGEAPEPQKRGGDTFINEILTSKPGKHGKTNQQR